MKPVEPVEPAGSTEDRGARRVRAFDIRMVIALLIGVYGAVLLVLGLGFTDDAEIAKAAGVNINLWAGLGMVLGAAAFGIWAWLRPVRVPDAPPDGPD